MVTSSASPSHLPITISLRRTGRARIERINPLSTSLEISGPATTAALSASTPLYTNVTKISSCELTMITSSWLGGLPFGPVTVVIL